MIFTNCLLEKRQTIHEKIQFMHIFGLKTKISKIVSDLSWRIFWELFNAVFKIPKSLLHPEIFNKTQKTTKNSWKNTVFCIFFIKNPKMFWFSIKHFQRAFQCRFQNSKIFTASGDIQQKTQKTTKKSRKNTVFCVFWG